MLTSHEYYKKFGWFQNPFTLNIIPDLMVGYTEQTESILAHIFNHHKIAVIIGPTGSGKTTLLNWINDNVNKSNGFYAYYIPKPPIVKEELVSLFKVALGFNIVDKIRHGNISILNVQKYLLKKTHEKKTIFLIDEAHECSLEVLEWIRTVNDIIPNLMLVFAGLPTFEKMLEKELPTLFMRITTKAYLHSLNENETETLIRKRIEKVGGNGIEPFTYDSISKIYEITGGFPREIIKTCDQLIHEASRKNASTITSAFIHQVFQSLPSVPKDEETTTNLTLKQREILDLLNKKPNISPTDIVESINISEYKTKSHAIRSINNILRRLMSEELIKRKKMGTSYLYSLTGKSRTIFAEA